MNIIAETNVFLQLAQPVFQRKVHKLLEFGFKSLSLQRIISLSSNARSTVSNRHTAESKIFRLTKTCRFLESFPDLIAHLGLLKSGDCVAIDFYKQRWCPSLSHLFQLFLTFNLIINRLSLCAP